MKNSNDVIQHDLEYINSNLQEEFSRLAGKKVLISGGAGFLGYYLIHSILYWNLKTEISRHIRLTVYDNFIRGVPSWLSHLKSHPDLTLIRHDIVKPISPKVGHFHYIIHAASIASPTYYRMHPIETMDANVKGVRNLLDYSRKQKKIEKPIEGFLFFSSSEIYGDPSPADIPTPETCRGNVSCTGPRACYDESKRYGETLCVNFAREYKLSVKIARPFNNYGPGLKITDKRVIPDFAHDVLSSNDIVMLSNGSPKRTFCYIADAIIGYYKILVRGRSGEAYNIGVEEPEISVAELADKIITVGNALFNYKGKVVYQRSFENEYLIDNPNRRCPKISKARDELGYNPAISLSDGLKRSLLWYKDHPGGKEA